MKPNVNYRRRPGGAPRGMALVIVLASLIFLSALAIAFLVSIGTELKSSRRYADGVSTSMLAQSAFNLAITQLVEGTRGVDEGGDPVAWASQPGMIRTYTDSGTPAAYYKLYSWDAMTGSGTFDAVAEADVLGGWQAQPALFTDLNQPATVDGRTIYPILNPDAEGVVEGFSIDGSHAAVSAESRAPMPVKWIYVLDDGGIVAPGGGSGRTATFSGPKAPTAENPIVGRIAFWADDETSKVNINTASEGSYVDMPRTSSQYDRTQLAQNQPVKNEYQRYPGHPATTSLSPVFESLASSSAYPENIYPMTPRYMAGGSRGGAVNTITLDKLEADDKPPGFGNNRLYASIDELVFAPTLASLERETNGLGDVNRDTLEKAKFFISAHSRAPDVNLFNKPRVGIWPTSGNPGSDYRTPYDRVIAFCLSMRNDLQTPYIYYFQREDRDSTTHDLPASPSDSGVGRNRRLLEYLRTLTSGSIPGFGGSFAEKYGATNGSGTERDQILTEIFDYIRCTNLLDPDASVRKFAPNVPPINANYQFSGAGQVVPIRDPSTNTKGFGRFPTVSKAFLQFLRTGGSGGTVTIQAGLFIEFFDPSMGFSRLVPNYSVKISGLDAFEWGADDSSLVSMGFRGEGSYRPIGYAFRDEIYLGGRISFALMPGGRSEAAYPFLSTRWSLPSTNTTFSFRGGPITIAIRNQLNGELVQTVSMVFPPDGGQPMRIPVPDLAPSYRSFAERWKAWGTPSSATIQSQDVVRGIEADPGDLRLVAALASVPADYYSPHKYYNDPARRFAHSLRNGEGNSFYGATGGRLVDVSYRGYQDDYTTWEKRWDWGLPSTTGVAVGKPDPYVSGDIPGDWDNGLGGLPDGPYINKADEGNNPRNNPTWLPYFERENFRFQRMDNAHFSANRLMPSAVMFGSLPSGVIANRPWQTLHFRPGPAGHPGLVSPKDHLLLDLFHMPVVEPYAISEPLSTAGRINMNYQIVPFGYINRDTGIRAVLKSERVIGIGDADASDYKQAAATSKNFRFDINADETLEGFKDRFDQGDIFRSASEICDLHLVPEGETYDGMDRYWDDKRLTGDNSRERPYATIYPRLTTKSNTFTVHARVQSLQKRSGSDPAVWDEERDMVTGEYRGYQTIERYVDPNDARIPDYAKPDENTPISDFYKTRVLASKQFAP